MAEMLTKAEMTERADMLNTAAARSPEMPDGLTQPEQMYFAVMRALYGDYRRGVITREKARAEKAKAAEAYIDAAYAHRLYQHQAELERVFHREFHKNGCGCAKAGECRLYRIICGLEGVS